jgi:hypothetical protein
MTKKSVLDAFHLNYEPMNSKKEHDIDLHRRHYRDTLNTERFYVRCLLLGIARA